jgi:phenylalanyl-tRNA synthetase beta chain
MRIEQSDQIAYLERLGFGVEASGEDLEVTVPPDRHNDVTREVDLIEEVGRIHGLDEHLPSTLPAVAGRVGGLSREQRLRRRAEDTMRDLGFDEIVGWSFTDPGEAERLRIPVDDPRANPIALSNPLSEDQSAMRTTILGSLLDVAQRNQAHGADHVAIFESARVYQNHPPTGRNPRHTQGNRLIGPLSGGFPGEQEAPDCEPHRIGCLAVGPLIAKSWRGGGEPADFFALKGSLEALAGQLGVELAFEVGEEPFLHPGRSAHVRVGETAGWIGELHPLVCRAWDLEAAVGFEVDLAVLVAVASAGEETFEDVTSFPVVNRDIAVVAPIEIAAEQVRAAVLAGGGELLRAAEIFDLYEGEQVGKGSKSLALRLEFRAPDRTLTDEEVAPLRKEIIDTLKKIGVNIRTEQSA